MPQSGSEALPQTAESDFSFTANAVGWAREARALDISKGRQHTAEDLFHS
jgi:hypothetical protein